MTQRYRKTGQLNIFLPDQPKQEKEGGDIGSFFGGMFFLFFVIMVIGVASGG